MNAEGNWEEFDKSFAFAIHAVEQEFGVCVDGNYSLMKLFSQLEFLKFKAEKEKEEMDKAKGGGRKTFR